MRLERFFMVGLIDSANAILEVKNMVWFFFIYLYAYIFYIFFDNNVCYKLIKGENFYRSGYVCMFVYNKSELNNFPIQFL